MTPRRRGTIKIRRGKKGEIIKDYKLLSGKKVEEVYGADSDDYASSISDSDSSSDEEHVVVKTELEKEEEKNAELKYLIMQQQEERDKERKKIEKIKQIVNSNSLKF